MTTRDRPELELPPEMLRDAADLLRDQTDAGLLAETIVDEIFRRLLFAISLEDLISIRFRIVI